MVSFVCRIHSLGILIVLHELAICAIDIEHTWPGQCRTVSENSNVCLQHKSSLHVLQAVL